MDGTHQPAFQRFLSAEQLGRHHPFLRLLHADQPRQEPAGSRLHRHAALVEDEADAGGRRHHPHVHRQAHGDADAHRRAVDRRHDRFQAIEDRQRDRIAGIALLRLVAVVPHLEGAAAARDIGAGAEGPAGAADDDGAHLVHRVHALEEVYKFPAHRRVEGVELVGPVEGDGHDAVGEIGQQSLVCHGLSVPPGSFRSERRNVVARRCGLGNIRRNQIDPQSRRTSMSHLLKSVEDGVMKIVLNRPEAMNALSRDMMMGLTDALNEAAGSREVGCVVVRGAGDKAFCAGGDVKSMAAGRDQDKTYEDKVHDIRIRMQVSELLHEMGKPTIAMVNGVAAGAGLSLALAADMRFAGKSARMTTAFAKVGFSGDFGSHYFLHKLVGTAKARELYFTAEILNADQIEKLGLANRVVDDANLENETMSFAKKLAAGPRVAWWHVKKNMKVAEEGSLSEALDSEAARMIRTGETEDHKEAARAFVEKRAPVFKGY